jgi:hypothetical protein
MPPQQLVDAFGFLSLSTNPHALSQAALTVDSSF